MTSWRIGRRAFAVLTIMTVCLLGCDIASAQAKKTSKSTEDVKVVVDEEKSISKPITDDIDEAGESISNKLESFEKEASSILGGWVSYHVFLGISWLKLGVCAILLLVVFLVDRISHLVIFVRLRGLTEQRRRLEWTSVILDSFSKPLSLFIWAYGAYFALSPLFPHFAASDGSNLFQLVLRKAADFAGIIAVVWLAYRLIALVDVQIKRWTDATDHKIDDMLATLVGRILRVLVIVLGGLILLQNLTGIKIGPLLASLGLGGLAVALAAKDSVANFFGTVTILLDHPFEVGDVITLEGYTGTVETVGFRSTKIRTYEGHQIQIPNSKITNANVENVSRRPFMRWLTSLTLTYDTPPEKVDRAVAILREILDNHEGCNEDWPPQVHFNGFNDWSLNILVAAYYHPGDYWAFQAWLNKTCMEILKRFNDEGIEFAFPTQTLYLANDEKRQLKFETVLKMLKGEEAEA
jgi:MscS family membrane protein